MIRITSALLASTLALGCAPTTAVIGGKKVPRPTLGYTDGYYYAVRHYAAWPEPRGASSGLHAYAGRLAGYACGAEFTLESDYAGRELRLNGFVQPMFQSSGIQQPMHLEVQDRDGRRRITGNVGDSGFNATVVALGFSHSIDFSLGADGLHGQVATRRFDLERTDAETLAGTVRLSNGDVVPFEVHGLSTMWSMPAPDQAAIIPFMLSCSRVEEGRRDVGVTTDTAAPLLVVDFTRRS